MTAKGRKAPKRPPERCVNCWTEGITTNRPTTRPGPRCVTHMREHKAARTIMAHDAYVSRTYGVPRGFYFAMWRAQGGVCALCQHATGATKRLAIDHDHRCCPTTPLTCGGRCIRGLACGPCNQTLGWQARDDPAYGYRLAHYLERPPAQAVLMALGA